MIKYCIVNRTGRAVDYGIGTYSRQLLNFIQSEDKVTPVFLNLCRRIDCSRQELIDGVLNLYLPASTDCFDLASETLLDNAFIGHNVIFHFNHLIVDEWAPLLKKRYQSAIIVCTVHYLSWYYSLMGDKRMFYKIVESKGLETLHPNSKYTYYYYLKNTLNFQCCDYVIALCRETFNMLRETYNVNADNMFLIPNGIPLLEKTVIRNYDNPIINIIYVGRIDPIKGISFLAQAYNLAKIKYNNVRLHLVGDTDNDEYLQNCIEVCPDIIYYGRLPHSELDSLYRQADIGVLPSFHEQCSYSLIEMMSYGLPIIGTTATGINEMIEPIPFSRVPLELAFENESDLVKELAAAIIRLIDSMDLRKTCSDISHSLFCQKYTQELFYKNMNRFLTVLLSNVYDKGSDKIH